MPSSVAGILDQRGGLRVVVTEHWRMAAHVGRGERLFILPNVKVQEPLSTAQAIPLIEEVKRYVEANK